MVAKGRKRQRYNIHLWVDKWHRNQGVVDNGGYFRCLEVAKVEARKMFESVESVEVIDRHTGNAVFGLYPPHENFSIDEPCQCGKCRKK